MYVHFLWVATPCMRKVADVRCAPLSEVHLRTRSLDASRIKPWRAEALGFAKARCKLREGRSRVAHGTDEEFVDAWIIQKQLNPLCNGFSHHAVDAGPPLVELRAC